MTGHGISIRQKGGEHSGNYGHAGRPGEVGGSARSYIPGTGDYDFPKKKVKAGEIYLTDRKLAAALMHDYKGEGVPWDKTEKFFTLGKTIGTAIMEQSIRDITKRSGIDKEIVHNIINNWLTTSSNNDINNLSLQEAASQEFGAPLSEWQKAKIDEARESFGGIDRITERKVLRAIYDNTQELLADHGYKPDDTVTLYRGLALDDFDGDAGQIALWKGNAIESWSISPDVAKFYTRHRVSESDYKLKGLVVGIRVPVRNIMSSPATGMGSTVSGEYIIFGALPGQTVKVLYSKDEDWKEEDW